MKNQALFSSEDKSKKLKCCLLQFLFGALRVNNPMVNGHFQGKQLSFSFFHSFSMGLKRDVFG